MRFIDSCLDDEPPELTTLLENRACRPPHHARHGTWAAWGIGRTSLNHVRRAIYSDQQKRNGPISILMYHRNRNNCRTVQTGDGFRRRKAEALDLTGRDADTNYEPSGEDLHEASELRHVDRSPLLWLQDAVQGQR